MGAAVNYEGMTEWIVTFACGGGCVERAIREGEIAADVIYPDDLGCPAVAAVPAEGVEILAEWIKNGVRRVTIR